MSGTIQIGISKMLFWPDPSRIQTWPRVLASMNPDESFSTLAEIARKYLSNHETSDGHVGEVEVVRGFPGLEKIGDQVSLKGAGILEKTNQGLRISDYGNRLRSSYIEKPDGKEWVRDLARILVQREPRIRTLLRLMSETEACLVFSGDDWFQGAKARTKIWFPEEEPVFPFVDDVENSVRSLRTEVAASGWWGLGEWREHPLLEGFDRCEFAAIKGGPWSLHTIVSSVRAAFEVFSYLGVIRHNGPETWLDQDVAVSELGLDVAADFGWTTSGIITSQDPVQIMREAIESLQIETGYVVASQLRETLRARGMGNPDKEIGEFLKSGTMILEGEEHGQSRHGEGLFGDPGKQLVKLRVVNAN